REIAYLLGVVNSAFPGARVTDADLISSWAGVRPLIAPREERAGAPLDLSRSHVIRMAEPGWFDVAGGKLTTYRLMAEQTVDRVIEQLSGGRGSRRAESSGNAGSAGASPSNFAPCTTATTPLLDPDEAKFSGILPPPIARE